MGGFRSGLAGIKLGNNLSLPKMHVSLFNECIMQSFEYTAPDSKDIVARLART